MQTEYIQIKDLPQDTIDSAMRLVAQHATALILDDELVGSGTFIQCGRIYGILTAYHVRDNPKKPHKKFDFSLQSEQFLCIGIAEYAHRFGYEVKYLEVVDVGIPEDMEMGPDVSVIILPNAPPLGEIKARKYFYKIDHQREQRLEKSIQDVGLWMVCGMPVEFKKEELLSSGFDKVIILPGIGGCAGVSKRFDKNSFDFVDVEATNIVKNQQPKLFDGYSGGGLWRIPLTRQADGKITCDEVILGGIVFLQSAIENDAKTIRCHGGKTVYERVYEVLKSHPFF